MMLPPLESAHLETSHLYMPEQASAPVSNQANIASRYTTPASRRRRFSIPPALMGVAFAAIAIPGLFLYIVQPRQPEMTPEQQQKMAMYLDENKQAQQGMVASATNENENYVAADLTSADVAGATDDGTLAATADADLASANVKNKTYAYHLTLAQGFLKKAIELSKQSGAATQTEAQKQEIKQYLDQALESANAAIEADAREGAGFLVRARIYKTGSVLDTSLTELSDQDLQISRALGIDSNYLDKSQDIYDLLPTQQANDLANAPIIADAEEGNDASVSAQTEANSETGTIVLPAGQTEIAVPLPSLTENQSVQVAAAEGENAAGTTFIVKSRTAGTGFTLESTQALDQNVTLEWRIINQ